MAGGLSDSGDEDSSGVLAGDLIGELGLLLDEKDSADAEMPKRDFVDLRRPKDGRRGDVGGWLDTSWLGNGVWEATAGMDDYNTQ